MPYKLRKNAVANSKKWIENNKEPYLELQRKYYRNNASKKCMKVLKQTRYRNECIRFRMILLEIVFFISFI